MDDMARGVLAEQNLATSAKKSASREMEFKTMHLKVYSPLKVYFDEEVTSVSATNPTGPFDILPGHHNFITLLSPCVVEIRRQGRQGEQHIKISGGVMHVKADQAIVFLDV
jgi:F-type H+-transporting ATPase subunit epsilon